MKPAWDQLGDDFAASSSVLIADVDCTVEQDLCSEYEVRGYPTIKYFTSDTGPKGEDYNGGRDTESLTTFVKDKLEVKCSVSDPTECTDKEKAYITKMQAASSEDRTKAKTRLQPMLKEKMTPQNKQWVAQRLNILSQLEQ